MRSSEPSSDWAGAGGESHPPESRGNSGRSTPAERASLLNMYFRRRRKPKLGAIGDKLILDGVYAEEEPMSTPGVPAKRPRQAAPETCSPQAASWFQVVCESHGLWCPCDNPVSHLCAISAALESAPRAPAPPTWPGPSGGSAAGDRDGEGGDAVDDWAGVDLAALLDDAEREDPER